MAILIIIFLAISTIFYVLVIDYNDNNNNISIDTQPPVIQNITGSFFVNVGDTATIFIDFFDNRGVVEAKLFYKKSSDKNWSSKNILEGSADIKIPLNSDESWYYYVIINDKSGNGPVGEPSIDGSKFYTITVIDDKKDISHKVFIEEGTASWCSSCPDTAKIIQNIFDFDNPSFYYINLVQDKNNKANDRLYDDYNIYGFPTVFFDGGYETCCIDIMTENRNEDLFKQKISKVAIREVPRVYLNLKTTWNEELKELTTIVDVENYEINSYSGTLKIYITEIVSRWSDWDGNPYHFGFLDYAINKDFSISGGEVVTFSNKWNPADKGFSNIYPENLWVIAVLFNSESSDKYSDPPNNEYKFKAHYADASIGSRVNNGTLPPSVGISFPKEWRAYIIDRELEKLQFRNTILFGKTSIKIIYEAESGVEKVEFIVKGKFSEKTITVTQEPFEWKWKSLAFGKYTITVKLYDKEGRIATDSIEVFAFIL